MAAVVHKVLAQDPDVRAGTDSYVDDIIVNERVVPSSRVQEVLARHGLESKEPESLNGGRVLGSRVKREGTTLR